MKSSKITARLLSVVLAVMMLFSLVTVGFTASAAKVDVADTAADVEVAETGATIPAGTILYLKPNSNWTQSSAWFAMYTWGDSSATWVKMEKVADSSATVYKATMPSGTRDKVIFCRMNPSATALDWDSKWDQSQDLTWPGGTSNCWAPASGQWNNASGSWSTYADPTLITAPAAPAAPAVTVSGNLGGTGTEADPYLVAPETDVTMIITGTLGSANGLSYAVNSETKTDLAAGGNSTVATVTAPALDESAAVAVNLWAYNKAGTVVKYSETYATTTVYIKGYEATVDPDVPVVDNTFALGYQKVDGLYAYATTVETKEELGTNAWQRWHETTNAEGAKTRNFYLPASASDTELVVLNTYATQVLLNGVIIPAGEFAVVPYEAGTSYVCSGATTQTVTIYKTDAEGTIFMNSQEGTTTKNDAKEEATVDATYDLYAFLTSGSKNQEAGNVAGAVASAEDGLMEDTTVKKIKGRGNSTWGLAKKPFNITYKDNIQLDGMKGKKWSLLANAQDSSLLRNRLVYDLANEVNMMYACDSRFVDMFVNGYYQGSYQLTQKIEMGKNTVMPDLEEPIVEVEEEGDVVPTENFDFILELDTAINAANAGDQTFTTDRGQTMTHKVPDEPTDEQVAFMDAKYQALENALYSDDLATLETLVDINDFARAYLVNEVAKNLDSGVTSCYFVYNSTKDIFYMSPVWDYDNAIGNSHSIAERHDASGKMLDLSRPDGWYAKELMHYDSNFKGGRSVFSQACYMTSKTADGKSFMDIVADIWAADFADTAAILAGEADAANGRLQSTEDYLSSLAQSGNWNYGKGWQLSNNSNNSWIADHTALTMYSFDAETNTLTSENKTYDQTTFEGQANYAADWMISRINWISAQFADAEMTAPEGFVTVYFTNNWNFETQNVYYWGGTTGSCAAWPGERMLFVETNKNGENIYMAFVPADADGFLFNGISDQDHTTLRQTVDITVPTEANTGYYCDSEADNKISVKTYTYAPYVPEETTTTTVAGTTTTKAGTPDVPVTTTTKVEVEAEYITVYFSNAWKWTEVAIYYWNADGEQVAWPGVAMDYVETNDLGQDIYKATIPADATGMLFTGKDNGADTQSPDITDIKDGYGYYMDWNETDGNHVGEYEYAPTVKPEDPTTTTTTTKTEVVTPSSSSESGDTPDMPTVVTVYAINSANWEKVAAYAYDADGVAAVNWPGTLMEKTEETVNGADVYAISFDSKYVNVIFNNNDNGSQTDNLKTMDGQYYDIKAKTWYASLDDVPAADPLATNRFLVGSFNGWSTTANEFMLKAEGEKVGYVELELEAGDYEFKIVREDKWTAPKTATTITKSIAGLTFSSSGEANVKMTVTVAGTYVFAFGTDSSQLAVTYPGDETPDIPTQDEPKPDTTVKLAGSFTEWATGALEMTADETGKIFTISDIRLDAGKYEFKIVEFGTWLGNNGTIENVAEGWTFKAKDAEGNDVGNCTLNTKGGVYTFTFDTETDKLTVTAVLDKLVYDVTWNEGNFTVNAPASIDEATDLTFTIDTAEGYIVSAVIADMKIIEAVDGVYTIANVQGDVELLIITAQVVTEPEVMEFTVTFVNKDGETIATETVEYGQAATAPEAPVVDGYNFTGWDTKFDFVTMDLTVKATYKKISAPVEPATTGKLRIELAGGTSFTIAVNDGAARPQGASYVNTKMPIGATVTVVANTTNGLTFLGWMDEFGAIVSTTDTYTFVTSGNDYLKAVYQTVVEGVNTVIFKNSKASGGNGQILDMQYYAAGDEITFPGTPFAAGYEFTGWSMTAEQIQQKLAAGEDVTVIANWTVAKVYIDVTVNGGTISTAAQPGGQYLAYNALTVVAGAAPAGQKFAYWTDADGTIMSYDAEYKFYPAANTELTAVYVAESETIAKQPLVFISGDPSDMTKEAIMYTFVWDIDASIGTVTGAGLMQINQADYKEETFYHGSGDSKMFDRTFGAAQIKNKNTYSINKTGSLYDNTYVACLFIIYTDAATGQSVTIYSDILVTTKPAP